MGIQEFFDDAVNSGIDFFTSLPQDTLESFKRSIAGQGGKKGKSDGGGSGSGETSSGTPISDFQNSMGQTAGEAAAAATEQTSMPNIQGSPNDYYTYAEGHLMPERKVTIKTSGMNTTDPEMDESYFRIYPNTTRVGGVPKRYVEFEDAGYVGKNLVDKDGNIAREPYKPEYEAFGIIASFADPVSRRAFLQGLADKGFYGENGKPSTSMFDTQDLSAVAQLLLNANVAGRTWDVAYYGIMLDPNYKSESRSGYGRSIQYTPAEDVKAVFRDAAQKMLGRSLDEESLNRFAEAYRQIERGATGSEGPVSVSTAAEQRVMQEYGPERAAVGFTNLARIMDAMIRGGS